MPRSPLDAERLRSRLAPLTPGRVEVLPTVGSTSTALVDAVRADPDAWPDRSVLVADHQQAGRGRAGRTWTTPAGVALTCSVLLRPPAGVPADRLGWVPLLGGLATARALRDLGAPAVLKWPNDVLLPHAEDLPGWGGYRKVAGVLADLVPALAGGPAVVLGIGVNVAQDLDELPVPTATSLALSGVAVDREDLAVVLVARLIEADAAWRSAGGSGPVAQWSALSVTLGRDVTVSRPGGQDLVGRAVRLAADGALVVEHDGRTTEVHAGDVHVRAT